jgi:spore coat polysaccharide biosynthesis protein SpsF
MLVDINGKPMLQRVVDRARMSKVDDVIVATTVSSKPIIDYCEDNDINYCIGSEDDIVSRLFAAALATDASQVVRVWGDSPMTNPYVINKLLEMGTGVGGYVYAPFEPKGTGSALLDVKLLEYDNEHLTGDDRHWYHKYCIDRPFTVALVSPFDRSHLDFSVDDEKSLELVRAICV